MSTEKKSVVAKIILSDKDGKVGFSSSATITTDGERIMITSSQGNGLAQTIPLTSLSNVNFSPNEPETVIVTRKDFFVCSIRFHTHDDLMFFFHSIRKMQKEHYYYCKVPSQVDIKPFLFDSLRELKRHGYKKDFNLWKIWDIGERDVIVPSSISIERLEEAMTARQFCAVPSYTWGAWHIQVPSLSTSQDCRGCPNHPFVSGIKKRFGATLLRAGRPKVMVLDAFPSENDLKNYQIDLALLDEILCNIVNNVKFQNWRNSIGMNTQNSALSSSGPRNVLSPVGNRKLLQVVDTGTNPGIISEHYRSLCKFQFYNCKESEVELEFEKLFKITTSYYSDVFKMVADLESLQWVSIFVNKYVLHSKSVIAMISEGETIILQDGGPGCEHSDSLISSLVQVLVEPNYRTVDGFIVLVLKDWICSSFGLEGSEKTGASSDGPWPMFFLFITCVAEILLIYTDYFQFNKNFLIKILDEMYSSGLASLVRSAPSNTNTSDSINAGTNSASGSQPQGKSTIDIAVNNFVYALKSLGQDYTNPSYAPYFDIIDQIPVFPSMSWFDYVIRNNHYAKLAQTNFEDILLRGETGSTVSVSNIPCFYFPKLHTQSPLHEKCHQITKLSLVNICLSYISEDLTSLVNLNTLILDNNLITRIPHHFTNLSNLEVLSLNNNRISGVAVPLRNMDKMREINIQNNKLVDLEHIAYLTNLQVLSARENMIKQLPIKLSEMVKLKYLDLRQNEISYISSNSFKSLSGLEHLNLSRNKLEVIPEIFGYLPNLCILKLDNNSLLRAVPGSVLNCKHLSTLKIGYCKIKTLPLTLGNLKELIILDIRKNYISDIPPSLCKATNLLDLCISDNPITEIPIWFYRFSRLRRLRAARCKITKISSALGHITSLEHLDLSENLLTELPFTLGCLKSSLTELHIHGNNLSLPSYLSKGNTAELLDYLSQSMNDYSNTCRMKIMIVGQEKVGKSSLVAQLIKKRRVDSDASASNSTTPTLPHSTSFYDFDDLSPIKRTSKGSQTMMTYQPPTVSNGIRIHTAKFKLKPKHRDRAKAKEVTINLWDFAGQQIYQTTHQFFISGRSIFLLVFNLRDPSAEAKLEFWLKSIMARVSKPLILLVATHSESASPAQLERVEGIRVSFSSLYKGINFLNPFAVSCVTGENIDQLRSYLLSVVGETPDIIQALDSSYLLFEALINDFRENLTCPVITQAELMRIGQASSLYTQDQVVECARTFHKLGTIMYFDSLPELKDFIVLDVQWLFDVMATLFTTSQAFVQNGILEYSSLKQIWKNYPAGVHPQLMSLMQKFEIAFPVSDQKGLESAVTGRSTSYIRLSADSSDVGKQGSTTVQAFLIPALLNQKMPQDIINKHWFMEKQNQEEIRQRVIKFSFMPLGLFSRLIARLLQVTTAILVIWEHGLMAEIHSKNQQKFRPTTNSSATKIFVEHGFDTSYNSTKSNEIIIRVKGQNSVDVNDHFSTILEITLAVAGEWKQLEWDSFAIIPDKSNNNSLGMKIPISQAEKFHQEHKTTFDTPGVNGESVSIPLSLIIPEITVPECKIDRFFLEDVTLSDFLGEGAYGRVQIGKYKNNTYAIKEITLPKRKDKLRLNKERFRFREEIILHSTLGHPALVQLHAISEQNLCMMLELCPYGDLLSFIKDYNNTIDWNLRIKILEDIAIGLQYLHGMNIAHLDFKTPNILLKSLNPSSPHCALITDFGNATYFEGQKTMKNRKVENPTWLAPEILDNKPYIGTQVDIYAFGVVSYELLARLQFFGEVQFFTTIEEKVIAGERPTLSDSICPTSYKALVDNCWSPLPDRRPNPSSILSKIKDIKEKSKVEDWNGFYANSYTSYINHLIRQQSQSQDDNLSNNTSSSSPPNASAWVSFSKISHTDSEPETNTLKSTDKINSLKGFIRKINSATANNSSNSKKAKRKSDRASGFINPINIGQINSGTNTPVGSFTDRGTYMPSPSSSSSNSSTPLDSPTRTPSNPSGLMRVDSKSKSSTTFSPTRSDNTVNPTSPAQSRVVTFVTSKPPPPSTTSASSTLQTSDKGVTLSEFRSQGDVSGSTPVQIQSSNSNNNNGNNSSGEIAGSPPNSTWRRTYNDRSTEVSQISSKQSVLGLRVGTNRTTTDGTDINSISSSNQYDTTPSSPPSGRIHSFEEDPPSLSNNWSFRKSGRPASGALGSRPQK
eukprot:TRINITY_DN6077_c0_g1_i1.p1 TRINITY_DN6077_c0_g1~~TRINITY_DN6077_c0_g1_i1.p1  ORF type:complete len:2180 (-),score=456.03 TRINITY_DN6077_c0_g1_i1:394-6933(-)